ncbi:putative surface protein with fasciclin (FAS1) repeats [Catalinimonas alkaloidigena]|uniref:fasciclin domain-containing protein n=1 Tax=Catalinimonas alkaloidigena TaxID=1075417 RepID=UPI002407403A|nr:fasciclin domain-containing protein [Catalinimonas alkaloidigena]MDF9799471.1 putative surface protein with fasciclin (FAS1) repeats [Catalinimonas alkaloidigena]
MTLNIEKSRIFRALSILLALSMGVVLISCEEDEDVIDDGESELTIYEEIADSPDFTLLAAAIDKANLADQLDSEGSFTLLAPSDNAFISAGITNLDNYSADELADILEYHVINEELLIEDFVESKEEETLDGTLYVIPTEQSIYLNANAQFVRPVNVDATNGVIHVVDNVLEEPQNNVAEIIGDDEDLAILQEAIAQAGISDVLTQEGPYTIFAPTDAAFEKLFDELGVSSLAELSSDQLTDILQYHVIEERTFSPELEAGSQSTLLGENFTITFDNAILLVDDNETTENAVVVAGDRLGNNGVVHYIDEVMLPSASE